MDQRLDATPEDQHYTVHESGPINVSDIERAGAESYPRVEVVSRVEAPTSSLIANMRRMAAEGCKRSPKCPASGDGRCFNCQAADFIAKKAAPEELRRKDAIITSLKQDVIAALAKHARSVELLADVSDRLSQTADLALDLVGALVEVDEVLERIADGWVPDTIPEDDADGMCLELQRMACGARHKPYTSETAARFCMTTVEANLNERTT